MCTHPGDEVLAADDDSCLGEEPEAEQESDLDRAAELLSSAESRNAEIQRQLANPGFAQFRFPLYVGISGEGGNSWLAPADPEFRDRLRGDRWQPDVDVFETEKSVAVRVELAGQLVADTTSAYRVLETSHPPVYYIPLADIEAGVLFDNITMEDGGGLAVINRGAAGSGHGWSGANCVIWNCTAPYVKVQAPPRADSSIAASAPKSA